MFKSHLLHRDHHVVHSDGLQRAVVAVDSETKRQQVLTKKKSILHRVMHFEEHRLTTYLTHLKSQWELCSQSVKHKHRFLKNTCGSKVSSLEMLVLFSFLQFTQSVKFAESDLLSLYKAALYYH